jgi:hypothetical protein
VSLSESDSKTIYLDARLGKSARPSRPANAASRRAGPFS